MEKETEEKLAKSLTAETTELLEYIPYLLCDLWEIGSSPYDMEELIRKNIKHYENFEVLDLGCGKGAVSVKLAESLGIHVKGIDIIGDFIEFARKKSVEYEVSHLCEFVLGDINEAVTMEKDYDIVIFGAVGNVLGNPEETLRKLKKTIKDNGFILIDEAYLISSAESIKYKNYEYLPYDEWLCIFEKLGLRVAAEITVSAEQEVGSDAEMAFIEKRAEELIKKFPEKKSIFTGYIQSQKNEYEDLEENVKGVTWLLQKI
ncbi:bifunctional 2-polyprenyl-6-hydroxyphenol methylase/3-demethylubiquinol 3-O-methyltransferase UbiG [Sebaldella sp. S0638]|uniref:class I SAM-dependent methyltransferase n=1 Tax=Sebaldella sp. S0638 TaxID=2957809 RepID=UPI00209D307C|nr:class I SAM-dependent methyltransferase [Sebaldella sp. S0638]MCP1225253.1 methyltransferase domain-containing protein [Sebaldella sp. S0638]